MDVATERVSKRARPASLYVKHEFGRSTQPVVSSCQHSQASPPAARAARARGNFATCRASRAISMTASSTSAAPSPAPVATATRPVRPPTIGVPVSLETPRSEEHTSELQSRLHLVCRLLLEKKKNEIKRISTLQNEQ